MSTPAERRSARASTTSSSVSPMPTMMEDFVTRNPPYRLRHVLGLGPIERARLAGRDRAEAAASGAHGAEQHHGRRTFAPAFPDVGAVGLFTHREQAELAKRILELVVPVA